MEFGEIVVSDRRHRAGVIHPDQGSDIAISPSEFHSSGFEAATRHMRVSFEVTEGRDGKRHADRIIAESVLADHCAHHGATTFDQYKRSGAKLIF